MMTAISKSISVLTVLLSAVIAPCTLVSQEIDAARNDTNQTQQNNPDQNKLFHAVDVLPFNSQWTDSQSGVELEPLRLNLELERDQPVAGSNRILGPAPVPPTLGTNDINGTPIGSRMLQPVEVADEDSEAVPANPAALAAQEIPPALAPTIAATPLISDTSTLATHSQGWEIDNRAIAVPSFPPPEIVDPNVAMASFTQPLIDPNALGQNDETSSENGNKSDPGKSPAAELNEEELEKTQAPSNPLLAKRTLVEIGDFVAQQKALVDADTQLGENAKLARLQKLASISEFLQKSADFKNRTQQFENQKIEFQSTESEKRDQLITALEPEQPKIYEVTNSALLARELQQKRQALETRKKDLQSYEQAIKSHADRIPKIPSERAAANERLVKIQIAIGELGKVAPEDVDTQSNFLIARRRANELELKMLEAEVQRQELAGRVLPIERDLISRNITQLESEVQAWDKATTDLRKHEVAQEAARAREAAINADPRLKSLAQRNEELIGERTAISDKLQTLTGEVASVKTSADKIEKQKRGLEDKIKAAGLTSENGMRLVEMKKNLLSPGESQVRVKQVRNEMQAVNLRVVGLAQERDELAEPLKVVEELIGKSDPDDPMVKTALEFVLAKRNYLDELLSDLHSYRALLSDIEVDRKNLIEQLSSTREYIHENALWIHSSTMLGARDLVKAKAGLKSLTDPHKWYGLHQSAQARIASKPYEVAFATFGLIGLAGLNRRFKNGLKKKRPADQVEETTGGAA